MRLRNYLYIGIAALSFVACSDWTETERVTFTRTRRYNTPHPFY